MTSRSHGRAAAVPLAHDPTPQRTAPTARELRDRFHDRLDTEIDRVLTAFQDLVASCQVSDRTSNARAEYQTHVEASNLATSADHLLNLISHLKIAAVTQNVTEAKAESQSVQSRMANTKKEVSAHMFKLADGVSSTLSRLENHYYSSCTAWYPTDDDPN